MQIKGNICKINQRRFCVEFCNGCTAQKLERCPYEIVKIFDMSSILDTVPALDALTV